MAGLLKLKKNNLLAIRQKWIASIMPYKDHGREKLNEILRSKEAAIFNLDEEELLPHFAPEEWKLICFRRALTNDIENMDYDTFLNKYKIIIFSQLNAENIKNLRPKCIEYFSKCEDNQVESCLDSEEGKFFKLTRDDLRPPNFYEKTSRIVNTALTTAVGPDWTGKAIKMGTRFIPQNLLNAGQCLAASVVHAQSGNLKAAALAVMGTLSSLVTFSVEKTMNDPTYAAAKDLQKAEQLLRTT